MVDVSSAVISNSDMGGWSVVGADDENIVGGSIVLDADTPARWTLAGYLHEFGHLGGLDHNDEVRSVMNMAETPWRRYQKVDLDGLDDLDCKES